MSHFVSDVRNYVKEMIVGMIEVHAEVSKRRYVIPAMRERIFKAYKNTGGPGQPAYPTHTLISLARPLILISIFCSITDAVCT